MWWEICYCATQHEWSIWYHLSLGVITSKITPLIGGLCPVQWTLTAMGLHELPLVGGLCHVQRTLTIMDLEKSAPHQKTLSSQRTLTMLGHHELPLIGGLCHVQRTLTTKGLNDLPLVGGLCLLQWTSIIRGHKNDVEHTTTNQWRLGNIANDARSEYPKTSLQSRIILICSGKQMI